MVRGRVRRLVFLLLASGLLAQAAAATEIWVVGGDKLSTGGGSVILYSPAAGHDLEEVYWNPDGFVLQDIQFAPGTTTGWAVGWDGEIVRKDGDSDWVAQDSGSSSTFEQVAVCDESTAWTAGTGGTIVRTTDGGSNWTAMNSPTDRQIISISAVNAYHAWVVDNAGGFYRTTNQGQDWTTLQAPSELTRPLTVLFQTWEEGILVGWGGVARTEDEGDSWQVTGIGDSNPFQPPRIDASVDGLVVIASYTPEGSPSSDVLAMNAKEGEGWIGLSLGENYELPSPFSQPSFLSRNKGWLPAWEVSRPGFLPVPVILRTTNAGETFEEVHRTVDYRRWTAVVAVPEPSLVLLQIAALGCTAWLRFRRREMLSS